MSRILLVLGLLVACVGAAMLPALGVSLWYSDGASLGIGLAALLTIVFGLVLGALNWKTADKPISHRQGLAAVGLCWMAAGVAGALPFVLTGHLPFTNALFESVSGFTTTGATIFTDIEIIPKGLLFWRSLTHWLGGMGIVVLSLALMPLLGVGGMQLYKAEVSGPTPDRLTPRLHDTAKLLWTVYLGMTILEAVLLRLGGMDWFDAVNHTFSTVATGGFSTRNASIAAFSSPFIQWVIIFFMFAAGINFTLHLRLLRGEWRCFSSNQEFRTYTGLLLASAISITGVLVLSKTFPSSSVAEWEAVVRAATFQVVSICTTTGFITENYSLWPPFANIVLLFLTFTGGSAGSTAGGFKMMRVAVISRLASLELFHFLHPRSVRHPKIDGKPLSTAVITGIVGYLLIFLGLLLVCTIVLTLSNLNLETAFTASLTCLSNVGPGLGDVGPIDNFGGLPAFVKWVLTLAMLLGRLEVYAILVLFMPEFWKK